MRAHISNLSFMHTWVEQAHNEGVTLLPNCLQDHKHRNYMLCLSTVITHFGLRPID